MTVNLYGPTIYPRDKRTPGRLITRLNCIMTGVQDKAFIMCLVEPFKRSLPRLAALTRPAGKVGLTSTWPWAGALGFLNQHLFMG